MSASEGQSVGKALLQNLMAGAGSSSQFIGGLILGSVVCSYRSAQRDWKQSYRWTKSPQDNGDRILGLFPYRDCRLLPKFHHPLFRGLDPGLASLK